MARESVRRWVLSFARHTGAWVAENRLRAAIWVLTLVGFFAGVWVAALGEKDLRARLFAGGLAVLSAVLGLIIPKLIKQKAQAEKRRRIDMSLSSEMIGHVLMLSRVLEEAFPLYLHRPPGPFPGLKQSGHLSTDKFEALQQEILMFHEVHLYELVIDYYVSVVSFNMQTVAEPGVTLQVYRDAISILSKAIDLVDAMLRGSIIKGAPDGLSRKIRLYEQQRDASLLLIALRGTSYWELQALDIYMDTCQVIADYPELAAKYRLDHDPPKGWDDLPAVIKHGPEARWRGYLEKSRKMQWLAMLDDDDPS